MKFLFWRQFETVWASKSQRLKREADERPRREAERQLAAEKEEKRKLNLEYKAQSWKLAQSVREYIAAVDEAKEQGRLEIGDTEFENWRAWAIKHADDLDFIANGNPLVGLTEDPEHLFDLDEKPTPGYSSSYSSSGGGQPWRKWYVSALSSAIFAWNYHTYPYHINYGKMPSTTSTKKPTDRCANLW